MPARRLIILGSTGSIGAQAVEVVEHLRAVGRGDLVRVVGLSAGTNAGVLAEQASRLEVRELALAAGGVDVPGARVRTGPDAAVRLVREVECDLVLTAMVGAAGLPATLEAARLGRDIALANKETLVAAGGLVVPAARASGSRLLPVDSEHAGLWQCLAGVLGPDAAPPLVCPREVRRVTLTASGGPLRGLTREQIDAARPEAALRHPTWSMGRKVTIDSASLVNKALEIVEAHWLFGLPPERIEAVVHPQSLVHAWVEFEGGSVVAQVAPPDMRVPIQHALTWPERAASPARAIDPRTLSALTFEPVDTQRFPLIELGHRAIVDGGTAGAILSGANEAAVGAFLRADPPVTFGRMVGAVLDAYRSIKPGPLGSLEDFFRADARARAFVEERLAGAWAR